MLLIFCFFFCPYNSPNLRPIVANRLESCFLRIKCRCTYATMCAHNTRLLMKKTILHRPPSNIADIHSRTFKPIKYHKRYGSLLRIHRTHPRIFCNGLFGTNYAIFNTSRISRLLCTTIVVN